MSKEIRELEPKALWNKFSDLNSVPRPSKKEEKVRQFMVDFGENLNLETFVDNVGNVIIKKPASKGMEDRIPVVMQSHLDMVCQKNNDTDFDFDTQGIQMYIDGDWVKAKGTTLGADNGIGVASIMAILESNEIVHPQIDALFTIDEETGMTGALGLEGGLLTGKILLNLDTEDDDELGIGCAGGVDITAKRKYKEVEPAKDAKGYKVIVRGLKGGHSGMDIHLGRGNANKMMNRLLFNLPVCIATIQGGSLRNAIPRESVATIAVQSDKQQAFDDTFDVLVKTIKEEFATVEPNLEVVLEKIVSPKKVMNKKAQEQLLRAVYAAWNGVYRMSPDVPELVETSNNVARVIVGDGKIKIDNLTRSSVESTKWDLADTLLSTYEAGKFKVKMSGSYPGWKPNPDSKILSLMEDLYHKMYDDKPTVMACHAGLECGILGTNYPEMDMISFGPNIRGAHSPDERVSISSVQKYWPYLLETLKKIPKKTLKITKTNTI
jgi:dipeptidase D